MAKDNKFGTFGGVYTPSVLTILGVIMYLRLPWVVGNAGLQLSLMIILVAHVISVATGLSISSIATDKNVGAGGPYYIVSRSMGLPIGGTLGLALFVGLAFSISLYIIGFSESLLSEANIEASVTNIRIAGSITLLGLTIVTVISTAFAIKTQYVIFGLIGASLVSIFVGSPEAPEQALMHAREGGADVGEIFAIFFPAVTGFTAGVNMSGDLRNPKQSIPRGTMAAIATGFLVYVGLAIFLALRVPPDDLVNDKTVLVRVARFELLVTGGIWGATLSSALGSILGAPRILQALGADRIAPTWFAKGYGKTNEPRNALVLAFLIGLAGILIAELDVIARIVSMVFLTTYGFLNISCALESWASPDFRPEFKIPKSVSLIGAITCFVVMILLDIAAMAGSVLLMAGIYAWLKRKELRLDAGDAWEGFWASLVRAGLYRLSKERQQARNWRPNVLMFRRDTDEAASLESFAESLVGGNGLLTEFVLQQGVRSPVNIARVSAAEADEDRVGVFRQHVLVEQPGEAIESICRYHGFAGIRPNTVLLDWDEYRSRSAELSRTLSELAELDYNQLVYSAGEVLEGRPQVDVWWREGAGNLGFCLALVRFITAAELYRDAQLRFLLVSDDSASNDILRTRARRMIRDARVNAEIVVINNARQGLPVAEWVKRHSGDAALTVVGLDEGGADDAAALATLESTLDTASTVLAVRGNSGFADELSVGRKVSNSLVPAARETLHPISGELKAGDNPQVQARVSDIAERFERAVLSLHDRAIARLYVPHVELLRGLRAATERRASQLRERLAGENPRKQRKLVNRIHNSFLQEARTLFEDFLAAALPEQRDALDGRIEVFIASDELRPHDVEELIWVRDKLERFKPAEGDSGALRRFKRRRRIIAALKRSLPSYPAPVGLLENHALDRLIREVLLDSVQRATSDAHQLAVHLGKRMNEPDLVLELLRGVEEGQDVGNLIEEHLSQSLSHLDELIADERSRIERSRRRMVVQTRSVLEEYAALMQRLDARRERKYLTVREKERQKLEAELSEMAGPWHDNQRALVERALLSLKVSAVHHRLVALVSREREALAMAFRGGLLRDMDALLAKLEKLREALAEPGVEADKLAGGIRFEHKPDFDPGPLSERLTRETEHVVQDLPETVQTLDNDSIERLEEKGSRATEVESIDLSVRPLVQFSVESELVFMLHERLAALPAAEQRASAVGHDVARLIAFQVTEFEAEESQSPEDFAQHMLPAVDNGIERVTAERAKMAETVDSLLATVDDRLDAVLAKTSVYELASDSDSFDVHVRRERGRRAVTGVRGFALSLVGSLRRASVMALYRLSAGLLLARRLQQGAATPRHLVERVMGDVEAHSPARDVLAKLPYYYRQLFVGHATLNENFWVARAPEVKLARQAFASFRRGVKGCLVINGERGSGKSALWQHLVSRAFERHHAVRVHPVAGGSVEVRDFEAALRSAAGQPGSAAEVIRGLSAGSVVVLDDFELWWERSPHGLAVVDLVLDLIDRYGDRCFFVLCMNIQAYRFLSRLRPIDDRALSVVECGPVSAETLKEIITLRHESTGLSYTMGDTTQDSLSQWAVARLFAAHFHYSRGLVGPALQAWVAHIERCGKESIEIQRPGTIGVASFLELPAEQLGLLVQFTLHKQLSQSRVLRMLPMPARAAQQLLSSLERVGLLTEPRPRVYEINRFVHHLLVENLKGRGLLS